MVAAPIIAFSGSALTDGTRFHPQRCDKNTVADCIHQHASMFWDGLELRDSCRLTLDCGEVGVSGEDVVESELSEVLQAHGREDALAGVPATNPIRIRFGRKTGEGTRRCE